MVSKLFAGGGLTIIHLKELNSLDPIVNFDDADLVRHRQMLSTLSRIHENNPLPPLAHSPGHIRRNSHAGARGEATQP